MMFHNLDAQGVSEGRTVRYWKVVANLLRDAHLRADTEVDPHRRNRDASESEGATRRR